MRTLAIALLISATLGGAVTYAGITGISESPGASIPRVIARYPTKKDNKGYLNALVQPGRYWYDNSTGSFSIDTIKPANPSDVASWQGYVDANNAAAEIIFRLAMEKARTGDLATALSLLNKRIAAAPQEYPSLTLRAAIYSQLGRHDYAVEDLKVAEAWRAHYRSSPIAYDYDMFDRQEVLIKVALANEYILMGRMQAGKKDKDLESSLYFARNYGKRFRTEPAIGLALSRLEGIISAQQSGMNPARVAVINAALETAPQECVATRDYDEALAASYRAPEARLRLLQVHELCGDFAKAKALRAANSDLAVQKPFAERQWQVECTGRPEMLHRALAADYEVRSVGYRIGNFYLNCGRPSAALEPLQKAFAAFDTNRLKDPSEYYGYADVARGLSKSQAGSGDSLGAAHTLEKTVKVASRFLEATSTSYGTLLDDTRLATLTALQKNPGNLEATALSQSVLSLIKSRNALVEANNAKRLADAKRCGELPDIAGKLMDRTREDTMSVPPSLYVQRWEMTCNALHDLASEAGQRKCDAPTRRGLTSMANTAYGIGKSYADKWKKEYLEDLHMGCFTMPEI
jgi:tetratricopeptide (TPR) repeat protein